MTARRQHLVRYAALASAAVPHSRGDVVLDTDLSPQTMDGVFLADVWGTSTGPFAPGRPERAGR